MTAGLLFHDQILEAVVPNVRRFTRGEGGDLAHLVWTMHGEGSTDGYPYSLCGLLAPREASLRAPEEGDPEAEVCDRCTRLAAGEQLGDEPRDLEAGEISAEELARRFAADEDAPVAEPVAPDASDADHTEVLRPLPDQGS